MKIVVYIITLLVAIGGFGLYTNDKREDDRRSSRAFFCVELETLKKGERAEKRAEAKEKRAQAAEGRAYLKDVRKGRRQRLPGISDAEIQHSIDRNVRVARRADQRIIELRRDVERCLTA